jgi:hypothetical protein
MPTTLHEPAKILNRLYQLQGSADVPTLGEIYHAIRRDLATARSDELRMEFAERYDQAFGNRQDYALWRREFGKKNPTAISNAFPTTKDLLRDGLLSLEPVVVWGVLSLALGLATSERGDQLRVDGSHEPLALEMERAAFHRGLAPLSNALAGCALHRLFILGAIDRVRFEPTPSGTISLNQLTDYLNTMERLIGEIDPSWHPGRSVSLDALHGERPIGALGIFDLKLRLDEVLFCIRGTVRAGVRNHPRANPQVQESLARAAQFAFSSWRSTRSSRIFVACQGPGGRFRLTTSEEKECRALVRASQAAMDAGRLCLSAKLAFWTLRTMPKGLSRKPEFAALGDQLGANIRQFGYEPDKRFPRLKVARLDVKRDAEAAIPPQPENLRSAEDQPMTNCPESECTASGLQDPPIENSVSQTTDEQSGQHTRRSQLVVKGIVGYDPFKAQILADQQNSADWKLVLSVYGSNPWNPMDSLRRVVYDARRIKDEALLRAAFRLCAFKYRLPAYSVALIQHIQPTTEEVVTLAALLEHVTRAMPVGMNDELLRDWQNVLRNVWHGLPVSEKIYEEDILSLHEVLLGRGVAVLRASEHATEYAQQFFGDRDDNEIRHLLDCDLSLLHNVRRDRRGTNSKCDSKSSSRRPWKMSCGSPWCR